MPPRAFLLSISAPTKKLLQFFFWSPKKLTTSTISHSSELAKLANLPHSEILHPPSMSDSKRDLDPPIREVDLNQHSSLVEFSNFVSERERLELEALYPSVLNDKLTPLPHSKGGCEEPSFFLLVDDDRVETKLKKTSDAIDFGYPGLRVTSLEFVGLRYVPQSSSYSLASCFTDSKSSIKKVLTVIFDLYRKSIRTCSPESQQMNAQNNCSNSKHNTVYNAQEHSPSNNHIQQNGNVSGYTSEVYSYIQQHVEEDSRTSKKPAARRVICGGASCNHDNFGLPTWELIWKDDGGSSPLRRLRFQTDAAGFMLISSKLDSWSVAAHGDSIMTNAARLALSMDQNGLKQGSNDSPIYRSPGDLLPADTSDASFSTPTHNILSGSPGPSVIANGMQSLRASGKHLFGVRDPAEGDQVTPVNVNPISPHISENGLARAESIGQVQAARAAQRILAPDHEPHASQVQLPENFMSWGSVTMEGKYLPRREGQSLVLTDDHFKALAVTLPVRLRRSDWILLYSTGRDGISLNTLYRKVQRRGASILVVRDTKKHTFGCFCSEEWRVSPRYFGNGECFVFQVRPEMRAYRWTRANNYFMFSHSNFIAMGGGSHYSLLLNSDLLTGYSGESETFANEPLSSKEEFDVAHVEVWGFSKSLNLVYSIVE